MGPDLGAFLEPASRAGRALQTEGGLHGLLTCRLNHPAGTSPVPLGGLDSIPQIYVHLALRMWPYLEVGSLQM